MRQNSAKMVWPELSNSYFRRCAPKTPLTRPVASPKTMASWIMSASAQADVHGPCDSAERRIIRMGALPPLSGSLTKSRFGILGQSIPA